MRQGFACARAQLAARNTRLVMLLARRFGNTGVPLDELFSVGCVALMRAADTYNPQAQVKFSSYAGRCVYNAMLMFLRRHRAIEKNELSLETPVGRKSSGQPQLLAETLCSDPDPVYACVETSDILQHVRDALKFLTPRERQVVSLRFGLYSGVRMAQKDIAPQIGISKSRVSRIEKNALARIRYYLETGVQPKVRTVREKKEGSP